MGWILVWVVQLSYSLEVPPVFYLAHITLLFLVCCKHAAPLESSQTAQYQDGCIN